jgi:hypothetical protein
MEREPTVPAGSTLFTFQDIAEYAGPLAGSRPCHHVTGLRSTDLAEDTFVATDKARPKLREPDAEHTRMLWIAGIPP